MPMWPELGLGHRHPDLHHHAGAVAAAYLQHEISPQDAEAAAGDERHQGESTKKYSLRDPRKQEMNQEIAALMKKEGASPVWRLPAHAHPDAIPVRLLQHAGFRA